MLSLKAEVFLKNNIQEKMTSITPITNSGSNRNYFRINTSTKSFILTESEFVEENQSFLYFTELFLKHLINVPQVLAVSDDKTLYLQEDIGDLSLLDFLSKDGFNNQTHQLYKESLSQLASLQIKTKNLIDFSNCYDFKAFDQQQVLNDLFYFKDFFVERLNIPYSKNQLINEFFQMAEIIKSFDHSYFLYRDFQARNIFLKDEIPYFIDYQGGMQGFLGYDLVSLVFQAKANLPEDWQLKLKLHYAKIFINQGLISEEQFDQQYKMSLILRFLQILGAYGLRGLVERKTHFMESILHHLKNLKLLLNQNLLKPYPETERLITFIVSEKGENLINQLIKK